MSAFFKPMLQAGKPVPHCAVPNRRVSWHGRGRSNAVALRVSAKKSCYFWRYGGKIINPPAW